MVYGKEGRLLRRSRREESSMRVQILLCDDDKAFLERLTKEITSQPLPRGIQVDITRYTRPTDLSDRKLAQYQIMFLDIDMPGRTGMEIARRVRALRLDTIVIFVTNYPQFCIEGYEVRAFRYMLKQELAQKLPLYFQAALAELPRSDKSLHFAINAEPYSVPFSNILYLESRQRIIYMHTVQPERAGDHFYGTLEGLTEELEPEGFLRIQKSFLVNMEHIKKFNYNQVVLSNGEELPVSQRKYAELKIIYLNWKNKQWGKHDD